MNDKLNVYKSSFDRITVSDEKAQSILKNLETSTDKKLPQNHKFLKFALPIAAAFALVAIAAVIPSVHRSNAPTAVETNKTESSEIQKVPTLNGQYNWNEANTTGIAAMMYKDPKAVYKEVSRDEFNKRIGYDPTPKYIPHGYKTPRTSRKDVPIYVNPDGSWADCWSFDELWYKNENGNEIIIRVSPTGVKVYADNDVFSYAFTEEPKISYFDGFTATLSNIIPDEGELEDDKMHGIQPRQFAATFQINGNDYYAYTRGNVPEEEFLRVIQSLKP